MKNAKVTTYDIPAISDSTFDISNYPKTKK